MLKTFRIRSKLAVALALPLAALVALAAFEAVTATSDAREVREQTETARAALGPGSLVTTLQVERNLAGVTQLGLQGAVDLDADTNEEARAATDDSLAQLQAEVAEESSEVQSAFAPAFDALGELRTIRDDIDAYDGPQDLTSYEFARDKFDAYSAILGSVYDTTSTLATTLDEAVLRNGVEVIDAGARQTEASAQIVRWILLGQLTGQQDLPEFRRQVTEWVERSNAEEDAMFERMVGVYAPAREGPLDTGRDSEFIAEADRFIETGEADVDVMLSVVNSTDESGAEIDSASDIAARILDDEANGLLDDAIRRQWIFIALAAGIVGLALLVTWLASRSITRPLRSLRTQADEMATERLPGAVKQILETPAGEDVTLPEVEPVEVKTRDEVKEVAAALNTVQASALDLAEEQAVLRRNIADSFVNLGRRNQNLLNRQLELITDLERDEADPEELDSLFKLDHLATRMRRNAESLLVLAGVEAPRQWSAPVGVADVVRSALGEVGDYQRVSVRQLEPALVAGSVATDVAHVLAELIENALTFSPPDESVEIRGRASAVGYTLAIADNGLGMSDDDLARANRRLRAEESFTVAPSRYLGHYVAGHLAERHGVRVELVDHPPGGLTARVDLPASVLGDAAPEPQAESQAGGDGEAAVVEAASPQVGGADSSERITSGLPRRQPSNVGDATNGQESTPGVLTGAAAGSGVTASGLVRRVPGAQRPDTSVSGSPVATEPQGEPAGRANTLVARRGVLVPVELPRGRAARH